MNAKITVQSEGRDAFVITMPETVRIEKSWRNLTDTATVTLPRKILSEMFQLQDTRQVRTLFPNGAQIKIELGFNGEYYTEFEGYIIRTSDELPFTITCEDAMYLLKRVPVHVATRSTYLPDFIRSITDHPVKSIAPYELGPMRFANTTVTKVLEYLRDELQLYSYMDKGELVVGEIYADNQSDPVAINLDLATSNNLAYETRENEPVKVTAVSTLANGSKIEVTIGDQGGIEQRTAHYNITSKTDLENLAKEDLRKFNTNRYTGNFETYGDTIVNHGDKVSLSSTIYPERNGLYYCDKTVVYFDNTPRYRREIGLDELVE